MLSIKCLLPCYIFGLDFSHIVCAGKEDARQGAQDKGGGAENQREVRGGAAGDQHIQPQVHGGHDGRV